MKIGRRGPRKASAIQKKNLIQNAKKLAEDPLKVIPKCEDSCLICKFGRAKRKIKKIAKYSDDKRKLKKYAKRGPDLSKAVAATILFGIEEEADLITTARTPEGEIAYAKKGKASKKRLIGVQHFNDPKKRLIAYSKESKKGFYFYSMEDKVVCTGKKAKPPKKFVKDAIKRVPYDLSKEKGVYSCGHTDGDTEKTYFTLNWKGAGKKFSVCERCARKEVNLFVIFTERMLSKDTSDSFSLEGTLNMRCEGDCENCKFDGRISVSDDLREKYFKGLSDDQFLQKYGEDAKSVLKSRNELFIKGDVCYGEDMKTFLENLDFERWEKPAIVILLKKAGGAVLEDGTINELLEEHWKDHEIEVMRSILDDRGTIKEVLDKDLRPREMLRELYSKKKKKKEMKDLPEFKKLPPEGRFADKIGRVYKVKGEEEAINKIEEYSLSNKRVKAIAYGFYVVFGRADSKKWKYEDSEVESGEFLADYIEELLEAKGEDYAGKLQEVVKMSGSTEAVILENGREMR
ncbi:MAG: hypothetical protein KGY76_07410 [Candidatus Thermoplasmatota archaeon]|nr:hypothetical protein [Candidatus Thermoplasmatota archaeon]